VPESPFPAAASRLNSTTSEFMFVREAQYKVAYYFYEDKPCRAFTGEQKAFGRIYKGIEGTHGLWVYKKNVQHQAITFVSFVSGRSYSKRMTVPSGYPLFLDSTHTFYIATGLTTSSLVTPTLAIPDAKFLTQMQTMSDKRLFCDPNYFSAQIKDTVITVPIKLVTWAVKYLSGKTITQDVLKGFRSLLKMKVKKVQESEPFSQIEFFTNWLAFEQMILNCVTANTVDAASKKSNLLAKANLDFHNKVMRDIISNTHALPIGSPSCKQSFQLFVVLA
jgi:hypothetical protein